MLNTLYAKIAKNITDIRSQKDMSISQLAQLADVSERNLYRIEVGEQHIGFSTLVKIAAALEVELTDITEGIELPENIDG